MRSRVAVITADVLTARLAGPAIRALQIAAALSAAHRVVLCSTAACDIADARFECRAATSRELRAVVESADVVIIQGYVSNLAPWLLHGDKIVVVDLYDPLHLDKLEEFRDRPRAVRDAASDLAVRVLNEQVLRADFFLCASEEQRHLWLGHLGALGRVNPATYDADVTLRSLIDVCPFGLPDDPPRRTRAAIRGVVPGIGPEDKVILWAGGVYDWFDPLTLVRAVGRLAAAHPDVRLYFLGMAHPNPEVPQMRIARQTRELAAELGLTGRSVFFNEGWVEYADRQNYLLDADVGVSTHLEHLETAFSFRTRILDYLWAGLPIVATGGDTFGNLIAAEGWGRSVGQRDEAALSDALAEMLYDGAAAAAAREHVARAREWFTWSRTLAPLVDFCAHPARAADAEHDLSRIARRPVLPRHATSRRAVRTLSLLRGGGPRLLARELAARARRTARPGGR